MQRKPSEETHPSANPKNLHLPPMKRMPYQPNESLQNTVPPTTFTPNPQNFYYPRQGTAHEQAQPPFQPWQRQPYGSARGNMRPVVPNFAGAYHFPTVPPQQAIQSGNSRVGPSVPVSQFQRHFSYSHAPYVVPNFPIPPPPRPPPPPPPPRPHPFPMLSVPNRGPPGGMGCISDRCGISISAPLLVDQTFCQDWIQKYEDQKLNGVDDQNPPELTSPLSPFLNEAHFQFKPNKKSATVSLALEFVECDNVENDEICEESFDETYIPLGYEELFQANSPVSDPKSTKNGDQLSETRLYLLAIQIETKQLSSSVSETLALSKIEFVPGISAKNLSTQTEPATSSSLLQAHKFSSIGEFNNSCNACWSNLSTTKNVDYVQALIEELDVLDHDLLVSLDPGETNLGATETRSGGCIGLLIGISMQPSTAQIILDGQEENESPQFGTILFRFTRMTKFPQPPGPQDDPFSSRASIVEEKFFIGREYRVKSKTRLSIESSSFVPDGKKSQWSMDPHVLIMWDLMDHPATKGLKTIQNCLTSRETQEKENKYLYDIDSRLLSGPFDTSFANIVAFSSANATVKKQLKDVIFPGDPYFRAIFDVDNERSIVETNLTHVTISRMMGKAWLEQEENGAQKISGTNQDAENIGDDSFLSFFALDDILRMSLYPQKVRGQRSRQEHSKETLESKVIRHILRLRLILNLERHRSQEDMWEHDMYNIRFAKKILILPPGKVSVGSSGWVCSFCEAIWNKPCSTKEALRRTSGSESSYCAFHKAVFLNHATSKGKIRVDHSRGVPIIPPGLDFSNNESISAVWDILKRAPHHSLSGEIIVPGVGENRPLISMGDTIRLRFSAPMQGEAKDLSVEVLSQVAEVIVKTDTVKLYLPSPFGALQASQKLALPLPGLMCFYPYVQALLMAGLDSSKENDDVHAGSQFLDCWGVCAGGETIPIHSDRFPEEERNLIDNHIGRIDVRFGLRGGLGFDISHEVLDFCLKFVNGDSFNASWAGLRNHIIRVIAPSVATTSNVCRSGDRRILESKRNWACGSLNIEQKQVVSDILHRRHGEAPYILFGPPGTGKTLTLVEAITQILLEHGSRAHILACAPSDAACDVLAERLQDNLRHIEEHAHFLPKLCRVNWWARKIGSVRPKLLQLSPVTNESVFNIPSVGEMKEMNVIICQCFVAGCMDNERMSCVDIGWMRSHFSHVFIDESSQATESEALIPLLKVGGDCQIVLAGDPNQLSPTVRDPVAAQLGHSMSLQERLMSLDLYACGEFCCMTSLRDNYRSHDALLEVPSSLFYKRELRAVAPDHVKSSCVKWELLQDASSQERNFPMMVYDVDDGEEMSAIDTPSFFNLKECTVVRDLISQLLRSKKVQCHTGDIAVIAPFRAQVLKLRRILREANLGEVDVGVVEDFQGQERRVVFITTVLTRDHKRWTRKGGGLGFLNDPKRFNVSVTRAHALCIVVGSVDFVKRSGTYWTALVEHVERNDCLIGPNGKKSSYSSNRTDAGVEGLIRRVEELNLLGSGFFKDQYNLGTYYEDSPEWKVMLT